MENGNIGIKTIILKKLRFAVSESVSKAFLQDMDVRIWDDVITDRLLIATQMFILGRNIQDSIVETFEYPASWWQAFKQQYFPNFLKKYFPIKTISKNVILQHFHVCPHLNIATQSKHVEFVSMNKCEE